MNSTPTWLPTHRRASAGFGTARPTRLLRHGLLALAVAACVLLPAREAAADLVHYWTWDGVGTDFGSNPVAGALAGGAVYDATVFAPTAGNAGSLHVTSDGDAFVVGTLADLDSLAATLSGDFTFSLWARPSVNASAQPHDTSNIFDFGQAHGAGFGIQYNKNHGNWTSNQIGIYYAGTQFSSGVVGQADTWYHIALTKSGTDMALYIDGEQRATRTVSASPSFDYRSPADSTAGPLKFGDQAKTGPRNFTGHIDEGAIFGTVLTVPQVQALSVGVSPAAVEDVLTLVEYTFDTVHGFPATGGAGFNPTVGSHVIHASPVASSGNLAIGTENHGYQTDPVFRVGPGASNLASAIANDVYFEFGFEVEPTNTVDLTTLLFDVARGGGSTPRGFGLASSVDDFATILLSDDIPTVRPNLTSYLVDLTDPMFQDLSDVTFRMYVYAPSSGSTIEFDNIRINGIIPEPGTWLLLLSALACGLLVRRRRG